MERFFSPLLEQPEFKIVFLSLFFFLFSCFYWNRTAFRYRFLFVPCFGFELFVYLEFWSYSCLEQCSLNFCYTYLLYCEFIVSSLYFPSISGISTCTCCACKGIIVLFEFSLVTVLWSTYLCISFSIADILCEVGVVQLV